MKTPSPLLCLLVVTAALLAGAPSSGSAASATGHVTAQSPAAMAPSARQPIWLRELQRAASRVHRHCAGLLAELSTLYRPLPPAPPARSFASPAPFAGGDDAEMM